MNRSLPFVVLLCSASVSFGWDVKPDPPTEKAWVVQPGLAIPASEGDDIAFADTHGPFVLATIGKTNTREVFDLRTGQSVAKLDVGQNKPISDRELLSPNGKLWAFGKALSKEVKVYATDSGQAKPIVKVDGAIMNVGFTPDGRLLVITSANKQRTARLFNPTTGKEDSNWEIDATGYYLPGNATRVFAVSPGGKYLAASGAKVITLYSLSDGKKLAELELPAIERGGLQSMVGLAFSADGDEFAAVVGKSAKGTSTLKVWKLADGTTAEHTLNRPANLPGFFAPALAPILSGGWLIDGTQAWSGGQVRSIPETIGITPTRLAVTPTSLVAVIEPSPLERPRQKPTIGVLGGTGAASTVAKDGTLVGAVEMPTDEQAGWPGAVAAFSPPFAPAPHKLMVRKGVSGLTVSLDGRRCFVESDFGKRADTARRTILSVDAQSGASHSFELPEKRIIFGEAATGEAFLTIGAPDPVGSGERLELLTADGKSVAAWRPHPEVKPDPTKSSVLYAVAMNTSRAITVGAGRVTLWQLPEAKAVWSARMPEATGGGLSPDGKMLFVTHADGVRMLNADSGGTLGNLKADGGGGRRVQGGYTVSVSSDGRGLAVFDATALNRVVRVWDLTTGKQTFIVRPGTYDDSVTLRWLGTRFLLAGEQVFDTTDGRIVWKLKPPQVGAIATSAPSDERVWYVFGALGQAELQATAFPEEQLARFLTDYEKSGENGPFQKGEAVKVVIEATGAPPGWDAQARTSARIALSSAKLTENANAATVVKVTYTTVPGTPVKLKWQGIENFGREETINRFAVEARTEVTRNGQVVHTVPPTKTEMRIKEFPQVNEIDDDSKSGQEFFTKQVWKNASYSSGFVFAGSGTGIKQPNGVMWRLPGEAKIETNGLNMNWPAGYTSAGTIALGNPAIPDPPPATGAAPTASGWVLLVVGGLCAGVLVAAGAVVLVLVMRSKQRSQAEKDRPRRRQRDFEEDRPRRRRRREDDEDDEDDRPRRRRVD